MHERRSAFTPQLAVLSSTVLWGTLWIPVRRMHEEGSSGALATTLGFLIPLVVLLPAAVWRGERTLRGLRELGAPGLWLALGIALYTEGIVRGQVARIILLFYLMPVWSTLLARVVLGEPISARRLATIVLGLTGMLTIFGAGAGIPFPVASADWMGLAAGVSWALATVAANRGRSRPIFDRVFVHFVFLGPVFLLVTLVPGAGAGSGFDIDLRPHSVLWLLAFALIWMLPVVWLTLFGAGRIDPGRFAILLMFEIVIGLTTVALLTDEPLGRREIIGGLLILGASGAEFVTQGPLRFEGASRSRRGR
jgi:drug/metabolite transporter (DMT)-like permease